MDQWNLALLTKILFSTIALRFKWNWRLVAPLAALYVPPGTNNRIKHCMPCNFSLSNRAFSQHLHLHQLLASVEGWWTQSISKCITFFHTATAELLFILFSLSSQVPEENKAKMLEKMCSEKTFKGMSWATEKTLESFCSVFSSCGNISYFYYDRFGHSPYKYIRWSCRNHGYCCFFKLVKMMDRQVEWVSCCLSKDPVATTGYCCETFPSQFQFNIYSSSVQSKLFPKLCHHLS